MSQSSGSPGSGSLTTSGSDGSNASSPRRWEAVRRKGSMGSDILEVIDLREEEMKTARGSTQSSGSDKSPGWRGHHHLSARRNVNRDRDSQDSLYELVNGEPLPKPQRSQDTEDTVVGGMSVVPAVGSPPLSSWFSSKNSTIQTKLFAVTCFLLLHAVVIAAISMTKVSSHIAVGIGFSLITVLLITMIELRMVRESIAFTSETMRKEVDHRRSMEQAAYRFVPHEFLRLLGHTTVNAATAGDRRITELAVLFSDIRDFTYLSQALDNTEAFDWLSSITGRLTPVIRIHNGLVNKYLGDGMRCVFTTVDEATRAAIDMQRALEKATRTQEGFSRKVNMGVGIHFGSTTLGILGDEERLDTTMIGDTVFIANTLESLTKLYGCKVIISDVARGKLSQAKASNTLIRTIGKIPIKHSDEPLVLNDVFEADPPSIQSSKLNYQRTFSEALAAYANGEFQKSVDMLNQCVQQSLASVADKAVEVRLQFAQKMMKEEPGPGWSGVDEWHPE